MKLSRKGRARSLMLIKHLKIVYFVSTEYLMARLERKGESRTEHFASRGSFPSQPQNTIPRHRKQLRKIINSVGHFCRKTVWTVATGGAWLVTRCTRPATPFSLLLLRPGSIVEEAEGLTIEKTNGIHSHQRGATVFLAICHARSGSLAIACRQLACGHASPLGW